MPYVVPPKANSAISTGIIHFSRPLSDLMALLIPELIAPVEATTPMNPPIMSTKSATSMALAALVTGL